MANRLKDSTSPYLLSHAENPVEWYPWGQEALEKARAEKKPIFLSIGYSACHWCHVMERESFDNAKTAEIMNKLFVNIKVDREERPDIDAIYMKSVVLIAGHGGWPTSVWLTPELEPFYGGTYFPPMPRKGQPSFAQILLLLASAWRDKREEVVASGKELLEAVGRLSEVAQLPPVDPQDWLSKAVAVCRAQYDEQHGGFGGAPKFPHAMTLRYLLLEAVKGGPDQGDLFDLIDHSAEAMARGGIYDQIGGGFHRYSIDPEWTVPHFEKMLCDNALLLAFYSELVGYTKKPLYCWLVKTLVGWLKREMTLAHGGFASSTDADSEGAEGRYFLWNRQQLFSVLDAKEHRFFCEFYDVTDEGNFEGGHTVLTQNHDLKELAQDWQWDLAQASSVLKSAREKVLNERSRREAPGRDDKAVAAWNAQTVSALCRAARLAQLPEAAEMAVQAGQFLLTSFTTPGPEGELPRLVIGDCAQGVAQGEDVGSLVLAFFDLYELTLDDSWLAAALSMYDILLRDFWEEDRKLTAMTNPRVTDIPLRPFSFEDNATPSAHSLLLECARRHHRLTGDARSQKIWQLGMDSVAAVAQRAPTGLGMALQSASLWQSAGQELVIGGTLDQAQPFLQTLQGRFLPFLTVARSASAGLDSHLSTGKEDGKAYLCSGVSCQLPATTSDELQKQLSSSTHIL